MASCLYGSSDMLGLAREERLNHGLTIQEAMVRFQEAMACPLRNLNLSFKKAMASRLECA
jgi:hypothetical protein